MTLTVSIEQKQLFKKVGDLLTSIVPAGVEIGQGLINRVPMPNPDPGFINMTAMLQTPHRTPVETWDRDNPNPTTIDIEQGVLVELQLDCVGEAANDWAVMIAAMMRSDYACERLAPEVAPLYVDNPLQAPIHNAESQYEFRWIVRAHVQYNPVISPAQEFAASLEVDLINVDEAYKP